MTDQPAEPAVTPHAQGHEERAPDDTVRATFARLYSDARAYAAAEADRQKLRAGLIAAGIRDAAIFAVIALMLIFAALVAFLIGLIIALVPYLGALGATFAILGGSLLVTIILLLLAKSRITRMKRAITP